MNILWCDFETRSRCDLKKHGIYNYAMDPSTEVLCLSYAFNEMEPTTWSPDESIELPNRIFNHKGMIYAHNAAFERLIFKHVLGMDFALEQFYCTAAQAAANQLPRSLEDVGRAISSDMRKDHKGAALIKKLSVPQKDGSFLNSPDLMRQMVEYCEQDVWTMRAISKALRPLSDDELHDYHVNERINDRGFLLDVELARAATRYAAAETKEIEARVREITDGAVKSVRSPTMREWVKDRVGPTALGFMRVWKDGEEKISIDKSVRSNLLELAGEDDYEVPHHVAEVIQAADDLWSSSVAKFERLSGLADPQDRIVRGSFVFNGGSATGRASSYGAQVHNFPRKSHNLSLSVRESIIKGEPIVPNYGDNTNAVLKQMLRPAIVPHEGTKLVVADWSSIEARVTPWMTNCEAGRRKLELFATGADVYKHNAAATFHVTPAEVTDHQRQVGKVQELACGFAGGVGAFANMARIYNLTLSEHESQRMVDAWRRANPWGPIYWEKVELAYTRAMRNEGKEFSAGRVTYLFKNGHLWYALPSGRILCYPFARFEGDGSISYIKAAWKPAQDAKEWPRARLWRGLAVENITQAVANDLLRHTLRQVDAVLHVHDEVVLEASDPEQAAEHLLKVMTTPPAWAVGLPLAAEVKIMERYGK
jgi:DNA polymerase